MSRLFWIGALVILLAPFVAAAFGVSPPVYEVDFKPNLKQIFPFTFLGDSDLDFEISIENGSLAQYAKISTDHLTGSGTVLVAVSLPAALETPGVNVIGIKGRQKNSRAQGIVLEGVAIASIRIRVPYPGEYAELALSTTNANAGDPINLYLTVWSRGSQAIRPDLTLDIYDTSGTHMDTISLGSHTIESTESLALIHTLQTKDYKPGRYRVVARAAYSGTETVAESSFRVGELFVDIVNYSNYFVRDKINRFDIEVESFWNDPLPLLYANVTLPGYPLANFVTLPGSVSGFQRAILTGYLDTRTISNETFEALITLNYENKSSTKSVQLSFARDKADYLTYALVGGAVLVIVALVGIILYLRRKVRSLSQKRRS